MISKPLLKQSVKANWVLWLVSTAAFCIILSVTKIVLGTADFDSMGGDQSLLLPYIAALAEKGLTLNGLFEALGMDPAMLERLADIDVMETFNEMFYAETGFLLPLVYVVITSNKLFASQVDRGSMAYVLSTPIKRSDVSYTQMLYLVSSLFIMFIFTALTDLLTTIAVGLELDVIQILLMNLGLFLTIFSISGICFMFSSLFNLSKHSLACGGGIAVFFYICKILGMFGSENFVDAGMGAKSMGVFNYMTLISLFDIPSISDLSAAFIWKFAILLAVGAAAYFAGIKFFAEKDLPL